MSDKSENRTLFLMYEVLKKNLGSLLRYFSGVDDKVAEEVPISELKSYTWTGGINIFIAFLIIPCSYIIVDYIRSPYGYSAYRESVQTTGNPFWVFIIGIILFFLYLFIKRYISSLQIKYVLNGKAIIPIVIFSFFLYLLSVFLFSLIFSRKITSLQVIALSKQKIAWENRVAKIDSIYSLKYKDELSSNERYDTSFVISVPKRQTNNLRHKIDSSRRVEEEKPIQKKISDINGQLSEIDVTFGGLFYILAALFLILYCSPTVVLFINRRDIYHEILSQNDVVATSLFEEKKREILLKLQKKAEINETLKAINELSAAGEIGMTQPYPEVFDINDPSALEKYADFQFDINNFESALNIYDDAIRINSESPELWKKKSATLKLLGSDSDAETSFKKYVELSRKAAFIQNLNDKIFIKSIKCINTRFYGDFNWNLKNNINVLLGKNGYGKSHLLSILAALAQDEDEILDRYQVFSDSNGEIKLQLFSNGSEEKIATLTENIRAKQLQYNELRKKRLDNSRNSNLPLSAEAQNLSNEIAQLFDQIESLRGRIEYKKSGLKNSLGKISILALPDLRFINRATDYTNSVTDDKAKKLLEFGAYHFIRQAPYESAIQNFLNTLSSKYLETKSKDTEIFRLINRVFYRLTRNEFVWDDIKWSPDNSSFIITVRTEGNEESLPIQKVSQGTLSIIVIFGLIYNYLLLRYPNITDSNLCKQHAIVIIDEIDAHLHPSWQQKIIGLLREEFPNVQFIITAHSPLVVAGCQEGEVSVLRKTSSGFAIETIEKNLIGLPIADIFQLVFEIEEKDEMYLEILALLPFKDVIEKKLQQLQNKVNKTKEDELEFKTLSSQIQKLSYLDQVVAIRDSKDLYENLKSEYAQKEFENLKLSQENNDLKRK